MSISAPIQALRRTALFAGLLALPCLFVGCVLFPASSVTEAAPGQAGSLPNIQTSTDAIELELVFVERPAEDPLLGTSLWQDVDEVASAPVATRSSLAENGFRVGQVGSNPPAALQTLLGIAEEVGHNPVGGDKQLVGRRLVVRSGVETEVQTSPVYEKSHVVIVDGEVTEEHDYQNVRCVLRVKATRLQDGWVKLDFTPEIHHGEMRMRHCPTDTGWELKNGQQVETRYGNRFSVTLNIGELAVVSSEKHASETMGDWFFQTHRNGRTSQRLLLVRLADMTRLEKISPQ